MRWKIWGQASQVHINPNEKEMIHHSSGNRCTSLKNKARVFREINSDVDTFEKLLENAHGGL